MGFVKSKISRAVRNLLRTRIDLSEPSARTSATTDAAENSSRWSGVNWKSTVVAASSNSLSHCSRAMPATAASSGEMSKLSFRDQFASVKPSIGASNFVKSIFMKIHNVHTHRAAANSLKSETRGSVCTPLLFRVFDVGESQPLGCINNPPLAYH